MKRSLRVLNVEDSVRDVALLTRHLTRAGYDLISERVETPAAMKAALESQEWDVILCDYSMPHFNALSALAILKEAGLDIPFIIISGTIGEDVAVEAMRAGAHDYLMKDNLVRLAPTIERELEEARSRYARRRAEEALRDSEDRYRDLVEHSHDLICTHDLEGRILSVNQAAVTLLGYDQNTLLTKNIRDILFTDSKDKFDDYIVELQKNGIAQGTMVVQTRTGEKRVWEYTNTLRTEGVVMPVVRGVAHDITEQMRAEAELRRSEAQYRRILETTYEGVWMFDAEMRTTYVNQRLAEMLGVSAEEMIGRSPLDFVSDDSLANLKERLKRRAEGIKEQYDLHLRRKDGSDLWVIVSATPIHGEQGEFAGSFSMLTDITERTRAEEEQARLNAQIESQRQRLNAIISNVPGIVWEAWGEPDATTQRIDFVSEYVEIMLGYSVEEWLSTPNMWLSIVHPDDRERAAKQSNDDFVKSADGTNEFRWIAKDGRVIWVESRTFTVCDEEGRPIGMRGVTIDITERKLAEQQIRLQATALQFAANAIVITDKQGTISSVNPAFTALTGYTPEEVLGRNTSILKSGRHDAAFYKTLWDTILSGQIFHGEMINRRKDGSLYFEEQTITPVKDEAGEIIHFVAIKQDVTERRRAEEALRESEERYRLLFDSNPLPMWVYDLETLGFLAVNAAAILHYGYSREEFLAMTIKDIRPPKDVRPLLENVSRVRKGIDQAGIWRHQKKNSQIIDVEITSHELIFDERHSELVLANDVTERRQIEAMQLRRASQAALRADISAALAESDGSLQSILKHCAEAIVQNLDAAFARIWTLNTEENVLELQASAGIYTHIDGSYARVPVGSFKIGLIAEDREPHITNDVQSDPRVSDKEWAEREGMIAFAGYPLIVEDRLVGVMAMFSRQRLAEDTLDALASVADIISQGIERKRAEEALRVSEEQLRQSQKLEAIGQLAGGIAHDFNNLLTVITGYSELTIRRLQAEDPLRQNIEEIKKAGERAASLTRQLLAFSRKQVLQPKVLDLNGVISELEKMLRRLIGEDVGLRTALGAELGSIKADPGQIEQIIMNLAVNARDAMPGGGHLTIETENVYLDEEYAKHHIGVAPGPYVMLAISDTGTGMDAETQARIFEPFFTTKEAGKGTGLGLSTVYGIVKQSGGNIWVYSEVGRGTTFKVYLPRVDEGAEEYKRSAEAEEAIQGAETILLAEDEEMVRKLARQVLEMHGYRVLEAANGGAALLICERHTETIHLLITDVIMPEMSGRELADRLSLLRPEMKVLYMSGYTDNAIVHQGVLDEGANFIQKPFSTEALARKVREVLDTPKRIL